MGDGTNVGNFLMEKSPAKALSTVKYQTSDLMYMELVLGMGLKLEYTQETMLKTRSGLSKVYIF